jgi:para-nitrobenzyl esterase
MFGKTMTGGTPQHPSAEQLGTCFARICDIVGSGSDALAKLRALDAKTLVGDLDFLDDVLETLKSAPAMAGTPMIDDKIVKDEPGVILSAGAAARVPMIIGNTEVEPPLYYPPKQDGYPYTYFGADAGKALLIYGFIPTIATMAIGMDMSMHEPARFAARMTTKYGNPAWLYRFSYVLENGRAFKEKASHADDVPYLFQSLDKLPWAGLIVTDKDRQMARAFSSYFTNFVKGADPNGGGLVQWPKFEQTAPPRYQLMQFTLNNGPVFGDDPLDRRIELVERAAGPP